jgi:hypothetical protein
MGVIFEWDAALEKSCYFTVLPLIKEFVLQQLKNDLAVKHVLDLGNICTIFRPNLLSLRPENNSFLNVSHRFCLNRGKSLRQCEEICETAYWQKIRKKGQAHFKSPGAFLL